MVIELTKESLDGLKTWKDIENSFTKIENDTDNAKIQVALSKLKENYHDIHVLKVEEKDNKQTFVEVGKENIYVLGEHLVHEAMKSNDREYYQIDLPKGTYYFVLTESETKISYEVLEEDTNMKDKNETQDTLNQNVGEHIFDAKVILLIVSVVLLISIIGMMVYKKKRG